MPRAPVREPLSTTPKMNSSASTVAMPRRSTRASPSHTAPIADHSSRLLRWFGWRMLPTARPGTVLRAIQSPSAHCGANTSTMAMPLLATPARTRPMQKARKAARPRPACCSAQAVCAVSAAARIRPALDSASDHGTPAHSGAARADSSSSAKAVCSAINPLPRGQAGPVSEEASKVSQPPQPISAAA